MPSVLTISDIGFPRSPRPAAALVAPAMSSSLDHRRLFFFFFQAEDGIRDDLVTGVQTCALPIKSSDHLVCRLLLGSEEHTSELQSPDHLVCRLLLEEIKYDVNRLVKRGIALFDLADKDHSLGAL